MSSFFLERDRADTRVGKSHGGVQRRSQTLLHRGHDIVECRLRLYRFVYFLLAIYFNTRHIGFKNSGHDCSTTVYNLALVYKTHLQTSIKILFRNSSPNQQINMLKASQHFLLYCSPQIPSLIFDDNLESFYWQRRKSVYKKEIYQKFTYRLIIIINSLINYLSGYTFEFLESRSRHLM